jgi:hypothetical protein
MADGTAERIREDPFRCPIVGSARDREIAHDIVERAKHETSRGLARVGA